MLETFPNLTMFLGGNLVELFFFCSPEAFVGFVLLLEKVAKFTLTEMEIKRKLCLTETDHDFDLDSIDVELSWLMGAKNYHNEIYQCDACKLNFTQKQTLESHCQNMCDRIGCNIQFKSHIELLEHLKSRHREKVFICDRTVVTKPLHTKRIYRSIWKRNTF